MTQDESYTNYLSHRWKSSPNGSLEWPEIDTYCDECGTEYLGDPREFEWLECPPCERTDP